MQMIEFAFEIICAPSYYYFLEKYFPCLLMDTYFSVHAIMNIFISTILYSLHKSLFYVIL